MRLEPHRYTGRLLAIIVLTVVLGLSLAFEVESDALTSHNDHRFLALSGQTETVPAASSR